MSYDTNPYLRILAEKKENNRVIMVEAEKHYRQAVANYRAIEREEESYRQGIEERLKGMEQIGLYTAQKDHGTRDFI